MSAILDFGPVEKIKKFAPNCPKCGKFSKFIIARWLAWDGQLHVVMNCKKHGVQEDWL